VARHPQDPLWARIAGVTDGKAKPKPLLRADEVRAQEQVARHPFNPASEMHGTTLSRLTGLERVGVNLVRLPPGKESCAYHTHECEEEFIYVLSGRGVAEIDGEEHEVGPGDFMGFAAPSVGHHMRNPFDEDLTYLVGGERRNVEIASFPRLGKRMVRRGDEIEIYPFEANEAFWPEPGDDS